MEWYEIVLLFSFLFSFLLLFLAAVLDERKKIQDYRAMLKKQMAFYDVAGEWFYHHMGDKP